VSAPTLAKGEVVILDNLGSHKGKSARNAIRARGAHLLFLPPYSPDLNPIEQVFAKLKHLLRAAETRHVEVAWRKLGELLDIFSEEECANYLKNSGYISGWLLSEASPRLLLLRPTPASAQPQGSLGALHCI